MKEERKKKIQAAIAGVVYHLQEVEAKGVLPPDNSYVNRPRSWSLYSRQLTMLNRDRFQRRVVKR
jgi:hypothetical protein